MAMQRQLAVLLVILALSWDTGGRFFKEFLFEECPACRGTRLLTCPYCKGTGALRSRPALLRARDGLVADEDDSYACTFCGPASPEEARDGTAAVAPPPLGDEPVDTNDPNDPHVIGKVPPSPWSAESKFRDINLARATANRFPLPYFGSPTQGLVRCRTCGGRGRRMIRAGYWGRFLGLSTPSWRESIAALAGQHVEGEKQRFLYGRRLPRVETPRRMYPALEGPTNLKEAQAPMFRDEAGSALLPEEPEDLGDGNALVGGGDNPRRRRRYRGFARRLNPADGFYFGNPELPNIREFSAPYEGLGQKRERLRGYRARFRDDP